MASTKDPLAASSTPLVLAIPAAGDRDSDGYAILQRVRAGSGGHLAWTDGRRYPARHRRAWCPW